MNHSTTLYFREGSSDKVYQAAIEPQNSLFLVTFAFGRRGSTLNTGVKTPVPVDFSTAQRVFNKLVAEKKAKGYTEGPDGTPYQHSDQQDKVSGVLPQLLNPIEERELSRYLDDPNWCMQEKHDGKRLLIRRHGDQITGINRRGLIIALPQSLERAALNLPEDCLIDGEVIGTIFHAFDLLELGSASMRELSYQQRYQALEALLRAVEKTGIHLVASFTDRLAKEAVLATLHCGGSEGVVFKHWDAPYSPGRPASGGSQLKHKFYATASFLVAGVHPDKRSVSVALFQESTRVPAGNVTIPSNHPIPGAGTIIDVRYLYAFRESGSVYQPIYLGTRDDVHPNDCTTRQLKYRTVDQDEDQS